MKRHSARKQTWLSENRNGSVAPMLVLILALLVGTFAITSTRLAVHERRAEVHRQSVAVLHSAIDSVADAEIAEGESVKLSIDDTAGHWVTVEAVSKPGEGRHWRATLYRNQQSVLALTRAAGSNK